MRSHWLKIPVSLIHDDLVSSHGYGNIIYDHLKYVLSLNGGAHLPLIIATVVDGKIQVIARHVYLHIARDLHRSRIRTSLRSEVQDTNDLLRQLPPGITITSRDEVDREEALTVIRDHHVYFFAEPLSAQARALFAAEILTLQVTLLGEVGPSLRSVCCKWDACSILIRAIYDGDSEEDRESIEAVATELIASFPQHEVTVEHIRRDFPQSYESLSLESWVYSRPETVTR